MAQWRGHEWCFTINAPRGSDEIEAEAYLDKFYTNMLTLECKYLVCKGELGETGNYHLQGFVIFKESRTFRDIKEIFGCGKMHLEKRAARSTSKQAADYVKKPETSWDLFPLIEIGKTKIDSNEPIQTCKTCRSKFCICDDYNLVTQNIKVKDCVKP